MRAEQMHRPLLRVAAVTAGLASGATHAAEWVITPSATASTQTQRNPFLGASEESRTDVSTGLSSQASFHLSRETEQSSLTLQPSVGIYRYPDKDQLDRDEEHLSASYGWRGETSSWAASVSAARDTTLTSELGNTGLTQGNLRHELYDISLGPTWRISERLSAQASVGSTINRYPGNESAVLENYRYDGGSVGMSYVLNERAIVSVSGSVSRLNSETRTDHTDNGSIMVNAQYAWSPLWNISAGIGPSLVRVAGTSEHGLVYRASVTRGFERAALSLAVSRSQQPSGSAIITDVDQASLSLSGTFTEQLTGTLAANYSRRRNAFRDFNLDLNNVRYGRLETGLSWRVSPGWQIGAGLGASLQKTEALFFNDQTGRGYDVRLSVSWNGKPYVH